MIKNLVFNIENIKDTQKILRIKNNVRQCQQPSKPNTPSSRFPLSNEVLVKKSDMADSPSYAGVKQTKFLLTKESSTISPNTQDRKRSIVEDIEMKYTNIKFRKVEKPAVSPSTSTIEIKKEIQTPTKAVSLVNKPQQVKQRPKIIVVQESPSSKHDQQEVVILNKQGCDKKMGNSSRSLICVSCSHKCTNLDDLNIHKKSCAKKPPNSEFICCKRKFVSQEDLNLHINTAHKNERKLSCNGCQALFLSLATLNEHASIIHNTKYKITASPIALTCKDCNEKFSSVDDLKKHGPKCCKSKAIES